MITNEEIKLHCQFFENCAKDYRQLAIQLINDLAKQNKLNLKEGYPLLAIIKSGKEKGVMNSWKYFRHGFDCCFGNLDTGQIIEVPLVFGQEFGVLDPYFFVNYIKTTAAYHPLPFQFSDSYKCGVRIIEQMLILKRFERISSNVEGHNGVVVREREKIEIKLYEPVAKKDKKFSFRKFFRK